jgi:hypothetical protein
MLPWEVDTTSQAIRAWIDENMELPDPQNEVQRCYRCLLHDCFYYEMLDCGSNQAVSWTDRRRRYLVDMYKTLRLNYNYEFADQVVQMVVRLASMSTLRQRYYDERSFAAANHFGREFWQRFLDTLHSGTGYRKVRSDQKKKKWTDNLKKKFEATGKTLELDAFGNPMLEEPFLDQEGWEIEKEVQEIEDDAKEEAKNRALPGDEDTLDVMADDDVVKPGQHDQNIEKYVPPAYSFEDPFVPDYDEDLPTYSGGVQRTESSDEGKKKSEDGKKKK